MKIRTLLLSVGLACVALFFVVILPGRFAIAQTSGPNQEVGTGQVSGVAPHFVQGAVLSEPPEITPEEAARLDRAWADIQQARDGYQVPTDPTAHYADQPTNPPTNPPYASSINRPEAPGDFVTYSNTIASCTVAGCVFRNPNEPTSGANGRMTLMTANSYGILSGDYGQTWGFVNPATTFPAAAGGVIGDFIADYERTRNMMLWYLQYAADGSSNNVVRLAVATSQADLANNVWHYYDFSAQQFGYPAGWWLDYPDLVTGGNFAYVTSNICFQNGPRNCRNAIVMRLNLNELVNAQVLSFNYFTTTLTNLRGAIGGLAPAYFGTHVDNNTLRIWSWQESSGSPTSVDRDVTAWITNTSTALSPDGTNWLGFDGHRVLAAFVAGGQVGFMWDSAQGGGYAQPNVRYARFAVSGLTLTDQGAIWSDDVAWGYPSAGTNDRGDVAGTIHYGGRASGTPVVPYPSLAGWVADGLNGGTIAPATTVFVASGNAGANRWGDYTSTRLHSMYGNTWVGTGYVLTPTATDYEPHHVWFGREQDRPPAHHNIYVDINYAGSSQTGSFWNPYRSIASGNFATVPGDTLTLEAGNYPGAVTLNRSYTINANGGTVVIGAP